MVAEDLVATLCTRRGAQIVSFLCGFCVSARVHFFYAASLVEGELLLLVGVYLFWGYLRKKAPIKLLGLLAVGERSSSLIALVL